MHYGLIKYIDERLYQLKNPNSIISSNLLQLLLIPAEKSNTESIIEPTINFLISILWYYAYKYVPI